MAKADETAPVKKGGMGVWLIFCVVALIATLGGAALPYGLAVAGVGLPGLSGGGEAKPDHKPAFVPVGDVVVNLSEERLTRYLRVKLILVVDGSQEKNVKKLFDKNKAILKNWLISHLSDKTLAEVSGASGVNRLRREIQDQFNATLFPDGSEKIHDVLFEEFVVQ
jgi:flagellar protein FliL